MKKQNGTNKYLKKKCNLSEWIDKFHKIILALPEAPQKQDLIYNINDQYIQKIRTSLSQKESCSKYYTKVIVNASDQFFRKPIYKQDLYGYKQYRDIPDPEKDVPDPEKEWIKIHDSHFKYSYIRNQCSISLLVLITQIYEKCIEMSLIIDDPSIRDIPKVYSSTLLKSVKKMKAKLYKELSENSENILNELQRNFGIYLNFIIELRNTLVHGQKVLDKNSSIFSSSSGRNRDNFNRNFIDRICNEISKHQSFDSDHTFFHFLRKNDSFSLIVDECSLKADHYLGCLIFEILKKWTP